MQRTLRASTTVLGAIVLGLVLASCADGTAKPDPSSASPSTSPIATASPTPTPPQLAEPIPCDAVLTQEGFDDLASTNLTPRDFTLQSWDYPLLGTISSDGVVCKWAGGGDVYVVVGQLSMDEATWDAMRTDLEAEGYIENTDTPVAGFIDGPDGSDESYPSRGFAWRDGILYYASYPGILEFVPAFQ